MRGRIRSFRDQVVVITGASSGIGRATAVAFAQRGSHIVVAARRKDALDEVAGDCEGLGVEALAVPCDVRDEDAVDGLARAAVERFGRIDVWVNNAAVMAYGAFEKTPSQVHRAVLETSLLGPIYGTRAVLPHFRRQGHGVLVQVASLYAKMTSPYVSAYITAKFGLLGFAEALRQELHDAPDIHVCSVLPASVDTPIFRHAANYAGRGPKPVPPVADVDRVVRAILRCVHDPKREVHVGRLMQLVAWFHAALPGVYDRFVPHVMDRFGLRQDDQPEGPGNVLEPVEEGTGTTGGWRHLTGEPEED